MKLETRLILNYYFKLWQRLLFIKNKRIKNNK